ncbi:hypothetical protein L873DRAFT_1822660 [Choiromyces venosus 120613-1]|uniref:Uncharacterized protein n=1 Tax=Choiromyces venosus 120613-1 TaxID=1336337 RepID=A0A3N4IX64_9PEZI|nr:hypothetical protein L873DRAFT_1822660 [Choiromyces venosus 120613-1]
MARSSSGNNNHTIPNGTTGSGPGKRTVGQTHGHPVRAVCYPVIPTLPQHAIALATSEVAPVSWSDSGLPFESLASRRGIDDPRDYGLSQSKSSLVQDNPYLQSPGKKFASNSSGPAELLFRAKKVSPATVVKEGLWANQEADFLRPSGPTDTMQFTR